MIIPIVLAVASVSLAVFWTTCAVIAYKAGVTYCRTEFPLALQTEEERRADRKFHKWMAIGGPIYLGILASMGDFKHGLYLKE